MKSEELRKIRKDIISALVAEDPELLGHCRGLAKGYEG